jgi:hypothetical protein
MAIGSQPTDGGIGPVIVTTQPAARLPNAPALDPINQILSQDRPTPTVVTIGATGIELVAEENVNRIALYAQARTGADFVLTPDPSASFSPPGGSGAARTPQVIHSTLYPVLCQGRWYVAGNVGVVVVVWESTLQG